MTRFIIRSIFVTLSVYAKNPNWQELTFIIFHCSQLLKSYFIVKSCFHVDNLSLCDLLHSTRVFNKRTRELLHNAPLVYIYSKCRISLL